MLRLKPRQHGISRVDRIYIVPFQRENLGERCCIPVSSSANKILDTVECSVVLRLRENLKYLCSRSAGLVTTATNAFKGLTNLDQVTSA